MAAKHRRIFLDLQRAILSGALPPGARLPSETSLARRHGVSRPTAAHALEALRQLNLVERRVGSGTYVRAAAPTAGSFGLIADGLGATEIVAPLTAAVAQAAQLAGWSTVLDAPIGDRSAERIAAAWERRGVRGVFFAPLEHHPVREAVNRSLAERLSAAGLAVVLLDRDVLEYPAASGYDLVGMDDFAAGFELGRHLVEQGVRRIVFVARPAYPATTDHRFAGVCAASPSAILAVGDPEKTAWLAAVLRQHGPDALVGSNDATAAVLLRGLAALHRPVPREVAVAGFDDAGMAAGLAPPLTTLRQPLEALGVSAVEAMLSRLGAPRLPARRILLRAQLLVRASTARALPAGPVR